MGGGRQNGCDSLDRMLSLEKCLLLLLDMRVTRTVMQRGGGLDERNSGSHFRYVHRSWFILLLSYTTQIVASCQNV